MFFSALANPLPPLFLLLLLHLQIRNPTPQRSSSAAAATATASFPDPVFLFLLRRRHHHVVKPLWLLLFARLLRSSLSLRFGRLLHPFVLAHVFTRFSALLEAGERRRAAGRREEEKEEAQAAEEERRRGAGTKRAAAAAVVNFFAGCFIALPALPTIFITCYALAEQRSPQWKCQCVCLIVAVCVWAGLAVSVCKGCSAGQKEGFFRAGVWSGFPWQHKAIPALGGFVNWSSW